MQGIRAWKLNGAIVLKQLSNIRQDLTIHLY